MSIKKFQSGGFIDEAELFSDDLDSEATGDAGEGTGTGSPLGGELTTGDDGNDAGEGNEGTEGVPSTPPFSAGINREEEGDGNEEGSQAAAAAGEEEGDSLPDLSNVELSGIELFLSDYGVKGGMIEYEDGESVRFTDLNEEEQHEVLSSLVKGSVPSIEEKFNLDDGEIGLINAVRESGAEGVEEFLNNLVDYRVNQVLTSKTASEIDFGSMGNDDMYIIHLKDKHPDFTDDQIADELVKAKDLASYNETVEAIKESYTWKQNELKTQMKQEENEGFTMELEAQRKEIVQSVEDLTDIAGARLNDDIKEFLLHDIMELNDNNDPILMEKVFSDPETMFKVNWFINYGEDYINTLNDYWKKEVSKAHKAGYEKSLNGMPKNPTIIGGDRQGRQASNGQEDIESNYVFGKEVSEEDLFE